MKNKNKVEQYFHQRNFSLPEIILLILVGISVFVMTFVRGGIPMGTPIFLVCIVAFCIIRSFKIKDSDIGLILDNMIRDNSIERSKTVIECYDYTNALVKKRKDGSVISSKYCITDVKFSSHAIVFTVYKLDLINRAIEKEAYTVAFNEKIVLVEKTIKTDVGFVEVSYIEFNGVTIPVTLKEYNTACLVHKICDIHTIYRGI